jgi:hypothetical protein|tara:strand:- start:146 stop:265 length:120 start_codon:yes stop_codon:yes gene_type:complete
LLSRRGVVFDVKKKKKKKKTTRKMALSRSPSPQQSLPLR